MGNNSRSADPKTSRGPHIQISYALNLILSGLGDSIMLAINLGGKKRTEPQTFTVVIKAINTSQLVYQEPPSVDNPNVLHHSHWQKESTHYVVAAYSKPGSVKGHPEVLSTRP
ncbi:hypothetical protein FRX31_024858 [Thalictrum thalictroides]|uniref:Uncharacterized protein n=1 Tax=Thalictrum thalictroides TaxID=46969 RepID=A0A7J6VKA4_THATH|nr:hypothetical protein FRX31_024858 [Thalictrum thalictroides]